MERGSTDFSAHFRNKYYSYRLQVKIRLVLFLVGVEPLNGVDVLGVCLIEVGE